MHEPPGAVHSQERITFVRYGNWHAAARMEVMVNAFMGKYCLFVSHDFPGKSSGLLCIKEVNFRKTSGNVNRVKGTEKASIHPVGAVLKFRR